MVSVAINSLEFGSMVRIYATNAAIYLSRYRKSMTKASFQFAPHSISAIFYPTRFCAGLHVCIYSKILNFD